VVPTADGEPSLDAEATAALRSFLQSGPRPLPFFDRGPGYRGLAGRDQAEVDVLEAGGTA